MIKKVLATTAAAVSIVGAGAAAAPEAMAIGNHNGTSSVNGNGATQFYGNSTTYGYMSPQIGLIQGSFNKPCIALGKVAAQGLLGGGLAGLQDINVLSSPQNQQCTENSTQAKGDEALSHILDNIPILSGNGAGNH
ncbi:RdlA protein [Streptomyces sp. RPA4-5]|uniref:rodlin n=1 Tax=Streptomyces TaxID=1883 RepID=UPI00143E56BB|nr:MULTISPECIES: rodlin [Streptomyces]MCX4639644.1 rodlin [Streptomyces platensis]QIY56874.1 RdlA protein [Streptomyces sp. RPA4-5]WJY39832.1 rodlin [Streptomyces sp. P9-2B-2]